MAIFTAANPSVAVNMSQLFGFEPTFGGNTIDSITTAIGMALVSDFPPSTAVVFSIEYSGVGPFVASGETPVSGSFDQMEVFIGGVLQASLTDIAPGFGNFGEIDLLGAYNVLRGNDTITGSNLDDLLFTGDGGTDSVEAGSGDDIITMAAAAGAPFHSIDGGANTDTIAAVSNVFTADKVLDLRNADVESIEAIVIEGGMTVRLLGSQIGAGLLSSAADVSRSFGAGGVTVEVVLASPGAANLSGFKVGAGVSINVFGSTGADTISGTGIGETIRGDAGADTVKGNGGNDRFLVAGTTGQFDAMNGGGGTDTLQAEGGGPLTLAGFNAASQSIEAWLGNGQGLLGNGDKNSFDLSGLASVSGLAFIDGGDGDDTIIGSDFADVIRGGAGKDAMTGGEGADTFDFDAIKEIGKKTGKADIITDFTPGIDRIDLSDIDANGAKKGDKKFKFIKKEGADFNGKAGVIIWDAIDKKGAANDKTVIQGDTNGNGKADFTLLLSTAAKLGLDSDNLIP